LTIVILTWEYPPRIVGDIARQVNRLALGLLERDVEVDVVTFHETLSGVEKLDGLRIHRVSNPVGYHVNILTWSLSLSTEFERVVSNLIYEEGGIALLDVHEWPCVPAASSLKKAFGLPFVYTVYSLEDHRSSNPSSPLSTSIKSIEWLGGYESQAIVARSDRVARDMEKIHAIPHGKIYVIRAETQTWLGETVELYGRMVSRR